MKNNLSDWAFQCLKITLEVTLGVAILVFVVYFAKQAIAKRKKRPKSNV